MQLLPALWLLSKPSGLTDVTNLSPNTSLSGEIYTKVIDFSANIPVLRYHVLGFRSVSLLLWSIPESPSKF